MKILVATEKPFANAAIEGIKKVIAEANFELALLEKGSKEDLKKKIVDFDGLIVRSDIVDKEVLDCAENLKVVVRAGAGYDNIDLDETKKRGICVMNTPGQNSNAVAELVFGMLVLIARNKYNGSAGIELKDKSIGILAYGQVGKNVARIAKGFGMTISAFDAFVPAEKIQEDGIIPAKSTTELFKNNQVISLHIPATPETVKSINKELIDLMPKNGILVNTARKEIINEDDLLEILKNRTDLKYVADVKPNNAEQLIAEVGDRVFFTPKKMGAQTAEANINAGIAAASQVVAYLTTGWNKFQVNK